MWWKLITGSKLTTQTNLIRQGRFWGEIVRWWWPCFPRMPHWRRRRKLRLRVIHFGLSLCLSITFTTTLSKGCQGSFVREAKEEASIQDPLFSFHADVKINHETCWQFYVFNCRTVTFRLLRATFCARQGLLQNHVRQFVENGNIFSLDKTEHYLPF